MSELSQPHDRFFSKIFSQVEIAEDILLSNIPALGNLVEPGTFEVCQEKFVNPELKKYFSDILLKVQLKNGEDGYIYLLLEHKSYPEPKVAFDLKEYMLPIWRNAQTKRFPLPFIFPIVIYHGKQSWKTNTNFASLVSIPEGMHSYVPHFEFYLFDLSQYSDNELKGHIRSRVLLLIMKHVFQHDFGERFIQICNLLGEMGDEKTALELMRSILEYIGNASDKINKEQVQEGVRSALPQVGDEVMPTLFEQLREEGREEGRQEGLQQGLQEGLQKGRLQAGKDWVRFALEMKFGTKGITFYNRIQDQLTIETTNRFREAIRNNAPFEELEAIVKENRV